MNKIKQFFLNISAFLGPVADAVKGRVNTEELAKTVVLAFSATGVVGVLQIVLSHVGAILIAPQDAQAATLILTFLIEYFRRKQQGDPKVS